MTPELSQLLELGAMSPVDVRFAETMVRLTGEDTGERADLLTLAAALASRAVQRGHVCAHIGREESLLDHEGMPVAELPPLDVEMLRQSELISDGSRRTPLVLDAQNRLYLFRYYDYERRLATALRHRAQTAVVVDEDLLQRSLERMFVADGDQRRAAETALRHNLAVISGGPGTGKTTTVAAILALLLEQAEARGESLRIQLVAPTGKAAQRMGESLLERVTKLETPESVRAAIPTKASTIHRALGYQPRTPTRFRRDKQNPMTVDVLLADEASMVDLALMTKLIEAVPEQARVILLGDRDQLASVDAGAVLADLWDAPALSACVTRLTKSYRFGDQSGIAALARAIVAGDADRALEVLRGERDMPYGEVALQDELREVDARSELPEALGIAVTGGFAPLFETADPPTRLAHLNRYRILCAHRRGPNGVLALNGAVERHLRAAGCIRERSVYYDGRPILITTNDHQLGLFNGDIGVVCADGGKRHVYFAGQRQLRAVPIGRLPQHETVFAMTVHKSQGSEVNRIALVLPSGRSAVLTRELLYTGVTRAREHVDLFASEAVLRHGIARRIDRASGLTDRLS